MPPSPAGSGRFARNVMHFARALRAAGVDAELHVFEAMPHGGFFGAPEDADLDAEIRRFVHDRLCSVSR